jgi:hypothetical protein
MFASYFDASGTKRDSDVLVIAGFVGEVDQWLRFESEWNDTLTTFEVPYLHMKEFAHFRGAFESWNGQEQKRVRFLDRLSRIAQRRTRKSFCRALRLRDFNALDEEYPLTEAFGSAFGFVGFACVDAVRVWHKEYGEDKPLEFLFEDGDADKHTLTHALETYFDINPIYRKKNQHVQFQLADWAAYEHRRASSDYLNKRGAFDNQSYKYRGSATVLLDRLVEDWGDIGVSEIRRMCESLGVPSRSTPISVQGDSSASV